GIKRAYDDGRVVKGLGNVESMAALLTDDPMDRFQDMGLDPEESLFYAQMDGKRTAADLLRSAPLPQDDARKLLYALRCANMIHFAPPDTVRAPTVQPIAAPPPPSPEPPELEPMPE